MLGLRRRRRPDRRRWAPYRALALDAATFLGSALILVSRRTAASRGRPADGDRPSMWAMTRAGARLVFGDRRLRTLVLFAWLCGFYVLPEGIAVPYAAKLSTGDPVDPGGHRAADGGDADRDGRWGRSCSARYVTPVGAAAHRWAGWRC